MNNLGDSSHPDYRFWTKGHSSVLVIVVDKIDLVISVLGKKALNFAIDNQIVNRTTNFT